VSNDLTLVRGSHQMAVGANLAYWKHDSTDGAIGPGWWLFDSSVTGLGLADFLTGNLRHMEQGKPAWLYMDQWQVGLFGQDTWRLSSRVTLNAGLRWEPFLGPHLRNDRISNFRLDNFRQGVRSTVFRNAPAGIIYPGDPGFPRGETLKAKWWNLAPRIGVAWDMTGDGRTAVRSSYGIAYDFMQASYLYFSVASTVPFTNRVRVFPTPGGFDDPWRDWPGQVPHPTPDAPGADAWFPAIGAFIPIDPDIDSTRVQSWNATVERQLGSNWGASVSYLGSYTDRLWGQVSMNPGVFLGLGPCTIAGVFYPTCTTAANIDERRVLALENPELGRSLGPVELITAAGSQDYHAVKLSVRHRADSGVWLSGNYTRSYCVGNDVSTGLGVAIGGSYLTGDPAFDRGNCSWTRRHLVNVSAGVRTPRFTNPALRALASDWAVSGIFNARSGTWLLVTTGRDNAFSGISNQRPNQVLEDPYGDKTLLNYLNPNAFAQPAAGTLGNHRARSIEGPGYWTVDVALSRLLSVGAAHRVELRVETFNLLNAFNWGDPVTNLASGTFGQIRTQAGAPRIMQFGVKYGF
jgi:hypothetical protein